jgi:hypothetical protein
MPALSRYSAAVKVGRVTIAANEAFNFTYSGVSDNGIPRKRRLEL